MFGSIQFGGLASGLDTNAIIKALLSVEAQPIQKLQQQKASEEKKISLLGTLNGLLGSLRDKAKAIATPATFRSFTVNNPDEGLAAIGVFGTATAGSHSLEVLSLASVARFAFNGVASPTTELGSGVLDFNIGATNVVIDNTGVDKKSLNEIAAEINSQAGADVTASVVNTGTSTAPSFRLVVAGKNTGDAFQATINTSSIPELGALPETLTVATNARIELDGLEIQRETNEFDDVLTGVSLEALSAEPGTVINFSVEIDTEGIKTSLNDFVGAFNEVIDFINKQNKFTKGDEGAANTVGGPLFGDSALSSIKRTLFGALFDVDIDAVQADTQGFSTLNLVGLELQLDGTLQVDAEKLDAKLAENLDAFEDLFVDADGFDNGGAQSFEPGFFTDLSPDTGLADDLARAIDQLLKPRKQADGSFLDGLIDLRKGSITSNIKVINSRVDLLTRQLEQTETTLVQRFAALEELISGLNSQGDFLSAQLAKGF